MMTSQVREEIARLLRTMDVKEGSNFPLNDLMALIQKAELEATSKVDRFEVIDDTGRAYVKGSIYGSPVKIELSYQDDGKTLKVFVKELKELGKD